MHRRPPYPSTPSEPPPHLQLHPSQQTRKPNFSQRRGPRDFTLEGMSVSRQPKHVHQARTRQTQGIALVVVLLSAMVLMVSLLAISATMTISSQRTTADQGTTLQAQYAAEAGLAQISSRLDEAYKLLKTLNVSTTSSSASAINTAMRTHAQNYCNTSLATLPTGYESYRNWSAAHKASGFPLCTVQPGANSNRYSLFASYITSGYPAGTTAATYWPTVFSVDTQTSSSVKVASTATSETWYSLSYQLLRPTRVTLVQPNYYRFYYNVAYNGVTSRGELRSTTGSTVVASRTISRQLSASNKEYYVEVQLPSFARNFVFRNNTKNTSNSQLYFAGGETFDGPVHTNGTPGFYKLSGQVPVFSDSFSTCSTSGTYANYSGSTSNNSTTADMRNTFQGGSPEFGVPCIGMPENSYNQLRAAYGGNVEDTTQLSCSDLAGNWGLKSNSSSCKGNSGRTGKNSDYNAIPGGVYYSKGNPSSGSNGSPNSDNTWNDVNGYGGGIYIKGNVNQLKLSVKNGRQVIEAQQIVPAVLIPTTTRFEEKSNGKWDVYVNNTKVKTLDGTFNGLIYVDGNVVDMRGDGTTAGDIASESQMTLTATGQIVIKDDITYTDDPLTNPNAANVLGIYSSGEKCDLSGAINSCGSVLVDGGLNKDINVSASIMASHAGEGFGAVKYNQNLGLLTGRKVRINLTGGVIEDQSQTVGDVSNNGYARAYKYDKRFKDGLVKPPFFPERTAQWQSETENFIDQQQVWQTVQY